MLAQEPFHLVPCEEIPKFSSTGTNASVRVFQLSADAKRESPRLCLFLMIS